MLNKKSTTLVLFLVVILIIAVFFVMQKNNDDNINQNENINFNQNVNKNQNINQLNKVIINGVDISDWKIYHNEEYGFEIKYPEDWEIDSVRSGLNEVVFNIEEIPGREAIKFTKNINNLTFEEFKKQKLEFYKSVTTNITALIISGEKAIKIETSEMGIIKIYFIHNNFAYEITTGGRIESLGILNNFKFID
ncbi:hypothetical protein HOD96_00865 [Candidatus Falkowbacteria bacterium]|jgi:hypothetical protein|nr:hypothetical protein [Candidatus Falkowbacteria bacterium]MBT4433190.1 hypothetical protein [Candidatus Falkowbacteria bacterium]